MAERNGDVVNDLFGNLSLGQTGRKPFVENAVERVNKRFQGTRWTDISNKRSYQWNSPRLSEKIGDAAEKATLKCLGSKKFCELIGEPIYLISGKRIPKLYLFPCSLEKN